MKKTIAFWVCAMLAPAYLCANEFDAEALNDLGLDAESISLATGRKQPIATSPVVATVITSDEIRKYGYRSIREALDKVPGLHVTPAGVLGLNLVNVRGFSSLFTLLYLVDGKPYHTSLYGSRADNIRRIPMELIERIEVLRGPGSSIYSTDAFLGVVNIITKKQLDGVTVRATGGSFDTYEVAVTGGGQVGSAEMVYGISVYDTKGHQPFVPVDGASFIDLQAETNTSLAPGYGNTDDNHISLETNFHNDDYLLSINFGEIDELGLSVGNLPILDQTGTQDVRTAGIFFQFPFFKNRNSKAIGSFALDYRTQARNNVNYFPPGSFGIFPDGVVGSSEQKEMRFAARIDGGYSGFEGHELSYSMQLRTESADITDFESNYAISSESPIGLVPTEPGTYDVTGNKGQREIVSIKLTDEFALSRSVTGSFGVSSDYNSKYNTSVLPRGALIWNATPDTSMKLLIGQAIRGPSFVESIDTGSPAIVHNPDLKVARITSYDIAIDTKINDKMRLKSNFFYHVTKNPVVYGTGFVDDPRLVPINLNEQIGKGMEIEASYSANAFLNFGFTGLFQKNTGDYEFGNPDVQDLGFIPHVKLGLKVDYQWKEFQMAATYSYLGDRNRPPGSLQPEAEEYGFLNFSLLYEPSEKLNLGLKVENLLDEYAFEATVGDYPYDNELPGRAVYLSLSSTW